MSAVLEDTTVEDGWLARRGCNHYLGTHDRGATIVKHLHFHSAQLPCETFGRRAVARHDSDFLNRSNGADCFDLRGCLGSGPEDGEHLGVAARQQVGREAGSRAGTQSRQVCPLYESRRVPCLAIEDHHDRTDGWQSAL